MQQRFGVTGSKGFIGTNFVKHLRSNTNYDVVEFFKDIMNASEVNVFVNKCDVIVHFAGINRSEDPIFLLDTNVLGTYNIVRECLRSKKKLIVAGSDYTEGVYGASKKICQSFVECLSPMHTQAVYVRIPKVFGPHCKPNYNSFLTTILYNIAHGIEYEKLIRDPHEKIRVIYVNDLCKRLQYLAEKDVSELYEHNIDIPSVHLWYDGEFSITISHFCRIANGATLASYPKSVHENIKNALEWYKYNANTFRRTRIFPGTVSS